MSETPLTVLEQLADQLIEGWSNSWILSNDTSIKSFVKEIFDGKETNQSLSDLEKEAIRKIKSQLGDRKNSDHLFVLVTEAALRRKVYSESRQKSIEAEIVKTRQLEIAEQKRRAELAEIALAEKTGQY